MAENQQMSTEKRQKNAKKFYCEKCDFGCNRFAEYKRHIDTRKHKSTENQQNQQEKHQKTPKSFIVKSVTLDVTDLPNIKDILTRENINQQKINKKNTENTKQLFFQYGGKRHKFYRKVLSRSENWTFLKMSFFAKLKIVCGKPCFFTPSD